MGFYGKGTLSRSEPSWVEREKARLKAKRMGGGTAEEATNARREKRRLFKLERARAEAEKIERQRLVEEGKLDASVLEAELETTNDDAVVHEVVEATPRSLETTAPTPATLPTFTAAEPGEEEEEESVPDFANQEHLQLTLEEAFFLSYGLGVLQIRSHPSDQDHIYTNHELLQESSAHCFFPPRPSLTHRVAPDDQFLLNYVTYHHFRSLGWVVRPGIKFSVDYLLYYRGPVFSHAEFGLIIFPAYTDPYWSTTEGMAARRVKEEKDWWWLHCVNRVQSQVLKTLVLCYVDVPAPNAVLGSDIGATLRGYKVREFVVKRWVANRSRD
jgi:tRNA-splicing endonuclease subunit Sen2